MRTLLCCAAALALAAAGCSATPEGPSSFDQARAAYMAGDYAAASGHCDAAIAAGERVGEATLLRGKCKEKTGDALGALADYEQAARVDPNLVEATLRATRIHLALGANDKARDTVETLFGGRYSSLSGRDRVLAHGMYGEVLIAWPDTANAVSEIEKGIKLALDTGMSGDPVVAILYYNLSRAQFSRANYRRARDAYARYLERANASAEDQYTFVVLLFLAGEVGTARSHAAKLPDELRVAAEQVLSGDALSVRGLFEAQQPQDSNNNNR
jgi:tetratricopeptide (TPR) repeat protein